ncbi:hypothetical protein [Streptomyces sp. NPDC026673]|uniref:hypothetical protein n=1 Tax=Streptomyces sp. NPDC026673 TaxID=3155724 RepID=UPI0033C1C44D
MIAPSRLITTFGPQSLLAIGGTSAAIGIIGTEDTARRAGVALLIVAAPLLVIRALTRLFVTDAARLAEAHTAGYRQALDHVARGLLDQYTAPTGPGRPPADGQTTGAVIELRRPDRHQPRRKAQGQ